MLSIKGKYRLKLKESPSARIASAVGDGWIQAGQFALREKRSKRKSKRECANILKASSDLYGHRPK